MDTIGIDESNSKFQQQKQEWVNQNSIERRRKTTTTKIVQAWWLFNRISIQSQCFFASGIESEIILISSKVIQLKSSVGTENAKEKMFLRSQWTNLVTYRPDKWCSQTYLIFLWEDNYSIICPVSMVNHFCKLSSNEPSVWFHCVLIKVGMCTRPIDALPKNRIRSLSFNRSNKCI